MNPQNNPMNKPCVGFTTNPALSIPLCSFVYPAFAPASSDTGFFFRTGTFGNTTALLTAACSGVCAPGYFGNATGQATPQCSGPCAAGWACPNVRGGSTTPTNTSCPAGQYRHGSAPLRACSHAYTCAWTCTHTRHTRSHTTHAPTHKLTHIHPHACAAGVRCQQSGLTVPSSPLPPPPPAV